MEFSIFRDPPEDNLTIQIPQRAQFSQVVTILRNHLKDNSLNYFEYIDEEDDNIIVRNNEDLQAVYCYYSSLVEDSRRQGCPPPPLQVFPRVNVSAAPPIVQNLLQETNYVPANSHFSPTTNLNRSPDYHMQSPTDSNTSNSGFLSSPEHMKNGAKTVPRKSDSFKSVDFSRSIHQSDVHFLGEMGHGNYGRVYRALHLPSQTVIAVKTIDLDLTEEIQRQIVSELSILTSCHSLYIIEFYGSFFVGSSIHICTEFMDGSSLDKYGRVPSEILGRIAVHLINGLAYLQQNKVLHRDLKPSNMLVNTRGQCKLCDFGVSTQLVQSIAKTYTGTCAYMAPERLKGGDYRFAADVWSLGVSLYELLCGALPFIMPGESVSNIIPNVLMDRIVSTQSIPHLPQSVCPVELSSFISQCISVTPELRPTVSGMLQHPLYGKYGGEGGNSMIAQWVMDFTQER